MSGLDKKESFPLTTISRIAWQRLHLTTIVAGLLLTMMPFLTGCAGEDPNVGGDAPAAATGIDASLAWQPVQDPSVSGYFVHYGRQSPGQAGSCAYENSTYADSPSATVTNLAPDTLYYFTDSAYNGLESSCSSEVSTVTPSPTPEPTPALPPSV